MTLRKPIGPLFRASGPDRSFHSRRRLRSGGPHPQHGGRAHEVVGDDSESDPSTHSVSATVPTTPQTMPTFEHTDPPLGSDAPALAAAEPSLAFVRAPRGGFRTAPRQDHAADTPIERVLFIGRRAKPTVTRRQIRRAAEDLLMSIQGGRPQGHVSRPRVVHLVRGDDLMLRFLNA